MLDKAEVSEEVELESSNISQGASDALRKCVTCNAEALDRSLDHNQQQKRNMIAATKTKHDWEGIKTYKLRGRAGGCVL